jgi:hypothetical protein
MNLADVLKKLPTPLATYQAPHALFEIYRAKDMQVARWHDPAVREIIKICRSSYARYGKRPLFDPQDNKAAIYVTRVMYEVSPGDRVEEWLSLRMVPGDGKPAGVFEPEIYRYAGKRIDVIMKAKIGAKDFWKHVASSSRMCGIHPYRILKNGAIEPLATSSHRYTPVCFALMHKQFILDYPLKEFPYQYITGVIRSDFYKKGLTYISGRHLSRPMFTSAYRFLGLPREKISVRRGAYSYTFPLYWFEMKKLLQLVNELRKKDNKPQLAKLTPDMFSNLPKQTRHPVPIAGVRIKPATMRSLIDRSVPDAP